MPEDPNADPIKLLKHASTMQDRSKRKSKKSGPKKKKVGRKKGVVKDDSATSKKSVSLKPPYNQEHLENLKKLCGLGATHREVASFFDISEDTLNKHCKQFYGESYRSIYKQYYDRSTISVRRALWQLGIDQKYWPALRYILNNRTEMRDNPEPEPTIETSVVYESEFGDSGEIVQNVKKGAALDDIEKFDVTDILLEHKTIDAVFDEEEKNVES
jgi:hypothetical protein